MRRVSRHIFGRLKSTKSKDEGGAGEGSGTEATSDAVSDDAIGALAFPDDCDGPSKGFDLVFVHGLRGSRLKTWTRDGIFWPYDLLKNDLKEARVITWGYDANTANAFAQARKESLFGHASTLLGDLARLREGITRPLIFICHSLGGLVVKQALITSSSYKAHGRFPTLGEIYGSTAGVVFMGTPHRGSATETYGDIAVKVAKLSLLQHNKQLLRTLSLDNHMLDHLNDAFTTVSNGMPIFCIREELGTGILGLIVPESSASYDGSNVRTGAIRANHMDMVKFAEGSEGYKGTLRWVKEIIMDYLQTTQQGMLESS